MKIAPDVWLSEQLERSVYKVTFEPSGESFDPQGLLKQGHVFAFTRIPVHDLRAIEWLEEHGFHLVDTNVVFEIEAERLADELPQDETVKFCFAAPEHEEGAVSVARENFRYSRFHIDPHIPVQMANNIKAAWVRNFFRGQRGDQMVVAIADGKVAGFNQVLYKGDGKLRIDLIATDHRFRNRGFAKQMVIYGARQISGVKQVIVGTQVTNVPSVRLYESMGFRLTEADYLFHYHYDSDGA